MPASVFGWLDVVAGAVVSAVSRQPTLLPASVTAVGVAVGAFQFVLTSRRERRRKTLELCERFILDEGTLQRWERLHITLNDGSFPLDTTVETGESPRLDATRLLNHLETICTGVNRRFYTGSVVRVYLEDYADLLFNHFLRQDPAPLTSSRFYASEFVEFRRAFRRPRFTPETASEAARKVARHLGAGSPSHPGDAAGGDARIASRLSFLADEQDRRRAS